MTYYCSLILSIYSSHSCKIGYGRKEEEEEGIGWRRVYDLRYFLQETVGEALSPMLFDGYSILNVCVNLYQD